MATIDPATPTRRKRRGFVLVGVALLAIGAGLVFLKTSIDEARESAARTQST